MHKMQQNLHLLQEARVPAADPPESPLTRKCTTVQVSYLKELQNSLLPTNGFGAFMVLVTSHLRGIIVGFYTP